MTVCVTGIRSVAVDVCALDEAAAFYEAVWRLSPAGQASDAVRYLRGTAAYHHLLSLHRADTPAIRRLVFAATDREAVATLHAKVKASGVVTEAPHDWNAPGGGYGFGFKDPEGRNLAVASGGGQHAAAHAPDRPHKITHINLNAGDYDATTRFMTEVLGFRLIDETVRAADGDLAAWFTTHGATAVVLRPDFYVYGVARDAMDVAQLVTSLGSAVSGAR